MFAGILIILATVAVADRAKSQDWHVNPRGVLVGRRHAPRRHLQTQDVPHQKHKSGTASAPPGTLAAVELGEAPPVGTEHLPDDPAGASKSVTTPGDEQKLSLAPDAKSLEPNDDVPTDEAMQSPAPSSDMATGTQQNRDAKGHDDVSKLDDDESASDGKSQETEEPPSEDVPGDNWEWVGSDEAKMDRSAKIGFTMFTSKDSKKQEGKHPKKRNEKVAAHTSQKNVGEHDKSKFGREKTIHCADGSTRQCAAGAHGCNDGSPKYCGKVDASTPEAAALVSQRSGPAAHTALTAKLGQSKAVLQTALATNQGGSAGCCYSFGYGSMNKPCCLETKPVSDVATCQANNDRMGGSSGSKLGSCPESAVEAAGLQSKVEG